MLPDTPDFDGWGGFLRAIEERFPGGRYIVNGMLLVGILAFFVFCLSFIVPAVKTVFQTVVGAQPTLKPLDFIIGPVATLAVWVLIGIWVGGRLGKLIAALHTMKTHAIELAKREDQIGEAFDGLQKLLAELKALTDTNLQTGRTNLQTGRIHGDSAQKLEALIGVMQQQVSMIQQQQLKSSPSEPGDKRRADVTPQNQEQR